MRIAIPTSSSGMVGLVFWLPQNPLLLPFPLPLPLLSFPFPCKITGRAMLVHLRIFLGVRRCHAARRLQYKTSFSILGPFKLVPHPSTNTLLPATPKNMRNPKNMCKRTSMALPMGSQGKGKNAECETWRHLGVPKFSANVAKRKENSHVSVFR